jgi:hypothetical protein
MRKAILILAAIAAIGFTLPVVSTAEAQDKVVIKSGDRGHHRGWHRGHRKVVVIKRGNRHHHHHRRGARVIVR